MQAVQQNAALAETDLQLRDLPQGDMKDKRGRWDHAGQSSQSILGLNENLLILLMRAGFSNMDTIRKIVFE